MLVTAEAERSDGPSAGNKVSKKRHLGASATELILTQALPAEMPQFWGGPCQPRRSKLPGRCDTLATL